LLTRRLMADMRCMVMLPAESRCISTPFMSVQRIGILGYDLHVHGLRLSQFGDHSPCSFRPVTPAAITATSS